MTEPRCAMCGRLIGTTPRRCPGGTTPGEPVAYRVEWVYDDTGRRHVFKRFVNHACSPFAWRDADYWARRTTRRDNPFRVELVEEWPEDHQ